MKNKKYSIWRIVHESVYTVTLEKVKDTNSEHEVDRINDGWNFTASFFRTEETINADYVQTFQPQ